MLLAIGAWFVPMMIASSAGGDLLAYRQEILFHQTITRYADAWHHHAPIYYYFVRIIPLFWLPLIALTPWLVPRWRRALGERDMLTAVLLAWVLIVVLFFTLSAGKRTLYILPALPAFAMAAGPWLPELLRARGPGRVAFGLATLITVIAAAAPVVLIARPDREAHLAATYGLHPVLPLALLALACAAVLSAGVRLRQGWIAYGGVLACVLVFTGTVVYPGLNAVRSARDFTERVEQATVGIRELGLVQPKEQYLLQIRRPVYNFGHARWREKENEAADAARWLAGDPSRALVVDKRMREPCFASASAVDLGKANRRHWYLVTGAPDPSCVEAGDPTAVRYYVPADVALNTGS